MKEVLITTEDGQCRAFVFARANDQPRPAVIMYMDGPGIRPAIQEMAARLAQAGYVVLLPDLFYRSGPYDPIDVKTVFSNPALREQHREKFMKGVTPAGAMRDTASFLSYLRTLAAVRSGPIGVVGYCMGGRLALIAAGTFPDEIAAAASYHGGGLANDQASSPHLLASSIKAKVYVAGAIEDANFPDDMKARLETALQHAGVDHRVETYPARHGWVPRDTLVHDHQQAERHWRTLIALFADALLQRQA